MFERRKPSNGVPSIYYFPGGLGDLIMLTPSFQYLYKQGRRIVLATDKRYFPLLHLPYIDELIDYITVDIKETFVVRIPTFCVAHHPRVEAFAIMLKSKVFSEPEISIPEDAATAAKNILDKYEIGSKFITCSFASVDWYRSMPNIAARRILGNFLSIYPDYKVIVLSALCGPCLGKLMNDPRVISCPVSLSACVGLIQSSRLHIGTNSGLMHVAGAIKSKGIALCGKEKGSMVFGCYPSINIIQSDKDCSPCWGQSTCKKPSCLYDIQITNQFSLLNLPLD